MPNTSLGPMAEWRLYKIAQLSLLIEVLTEVEVYRILKDKLGVLQP